MSDESGEKTELPTARKLSKMREDGKVWSSKDLAVAVGMMGVATVLATSLPQAASRFTAATASLFESGLKGPPDLRHVSDLLRTISSDVLLLMGAMFGMVLVVLFAQVRFLLTAKPFMPKLANFNPLPNLKNKIFSAKSWKKFAVSIAAFVVIASVSYVVIRSNLRPILLSGQLDVAGLGSLLFQLVQAIGWTVLTCMFFFAIFDLASQRQHFIKGAMMSKKDIEREQKESDGDPHQKAARQMLMQEISIGQMIAEVPNADVVVMNPTHYAAALRFDPKRDQAPRLIARGQGDIALRIREAAQRAGVPIRHDIGLARTLQKIRINATIPKELYNAVGIVLRFVESELSRAGRKPRWVDAEAKEAGADDGQD